MLQIKQYEMKLVINYKDHKDLYEYIKSYIKNCRSVCRDLFMEVNYSFNIKRCRINIGKRTD